MWAPAQLVLGAVHGRASVSGNLGASIRPVLTGPRKPWETENRTRSVLHQGHGPSRRCQATRGCGVTSVCSDGRVSGRKWPSPAGDVGLVGTPACGRLTQEPSLGAHPGIWRSVGGTRRVRDPHLPGPGGGWGARHAGGTGHAEHHQGLPAAPTAPRAPRDRHRADRRAPSAPTLKSVLRQMWRLGVSRPQPSALLWCPLLESTQTKPTPGPARPELLPVRTAVFRPVQGRARPHFLVTVSSWRKAFSSQNLQHNHFRSPQIQSAPRTPTRLPNTSETQKRAPLLTRGDAGRACLQLSKLAKGLGEARWPRGLSGNQTSTWPLQAPDGGL